MTQAGLRDVRIAVPWYKPDRNRTGRVPRYYLRETHQWLVLAQELNGLTVEEIDRSRPDSARCSIH